MFIPDEKLLRETYHLKGMSNVILVSRILRVVRGYKVLTIRQAYYVLVSRFPKDYSADRRFYKKLDRYLSKIRRLTPEIHQKFIDPTRKFAVPPLPYPKIELWCEKDSIKNFISPLAVKYRLGVQVLRGFASLSMYRRALERARKKGVEMVLYCGDFDPSGLLIEQVAAQEMDHKGPITFHRLAITWEQIQKFRPPSRSVNLKDSRTKDYVARWGSRVWDLESLRPRTCFKLIEVGLRKVVPKEFLLESEIQERATKIAKPTVERLQKNIESEVLRLLKAGLTESEIRRQIHEKYGP